MKNLMQNVFNSIVKYDESKNTTLVFEKINDTLKVILKNDTKHVIVRFQTDNDEIYIKEVVKLAIEELNAK